MSEQPYKDLGIDLKSNALAALGAITVVWGQIGAKMERMILIMCRADSAIDTMRAGLILTSQVSFHPRIRVLESLVKHNGWSGTDIAIYLGDFVKEVKRLSGIRNNFIHAANWYNDETTSPITSYAISGRLGSKEGYLIDSHSFNMEEAHELLLGMVNCHRSTLDLIFRIEERLAQNA